jgi:hypothetical protein
MSLQRRQFLQVLSYAFGASFILPRNQSAIAAQNPAQAASPAPEAKADAQHQSAQHQSARPQSAQRDLHNSNREEWKWKR